jgi:hypothetical protein
MNSNDVDSVTDIRLPCWKIDPSLPALEAEHIRDPLVYLVSLEDFKAYDSFPEYPKCTKSHTELNLNDSFIVFLSHAWINVPKRMQSRRMERRPEKAPKVDKSKYLDLFEGQVEDSEDEDEALIEERPRTPEACTKEYTVVDTIVGDKYKLYVEALEKIKEEYAPEMENLYIWMDYCCLDQKIGRVDPTEWDLNKSPIETINKIQDPREAGADLVLFDRVMKLADCMLTCVYDYAFNDTPWSLQQSGMGLHTDYKAPLWTRYLTRQWCRLEMAYCANVPFFDDVEDEEYSEEMIEAKKNAHKGDVFDRRLNPLVGKGISRVDRMLGCVNYERLQGRRPHLLYGTRESTLGTSPMLLPALTKDDILMRFPPTEGFFTKAEDGVILEKLNKELWPFMRKGEAGYEGERDLWGTAGGVGRKHGKGTMHYPNGNVYEGEWSKNTMEGQGKYSYYQGAGLEPDRYEGGFLNSVQHGEGTYTRRDGSMYRGEWANGKREGFGYYRWADGSEYRGYWKDDERDGFGKMEHKGNNYNGFWKRGRREGQGTMIWGDGETYTGEWKEDRRHGRGVGYNPFGRGAEYDGQWENGMKMGYGRLIIGKRTIPKPQVLEGMFSCDNYIGEDGWEEELNGGESDGRTSPLSHIYKKTRVSDTIFDIDSDAEDAAQATEAVAEAAELAREEKEEAEENLARELYAGEQAKAGGVYFFKDELASSIKPRERRMGRK